MTVSLTMDVRVGLVCRVVTAALDFLLLLNLMPTKKLVASSRSLTIPYKKTYSTNIPRAFKNGKYAEFLAAASTSASIPSLHGLPEVSHLNERGK